MKIMEGTPLLLGATYLGTHWNFAVFSPHLVTHLVIQDYETQKEIAVFPLHRAKNRTGTLWHIAVQGLPQRFLWGWRVKTEKKEHLAIDPYASLLYTGNEWGNNRWRQARDSGEVYAYGVATEPIPFQWTAPSPLKKPFSEHILYETHVRGFTKDMSSHVSSPGTWSGYMEKLDYLQSLGVTALELLPIFEFDETEWMRRHPGTGEILYNFWGYSPLHFFSPMQRYSSFHDPIQASHEFKCFINECHARSLSVILDVVYNHTGEGNEDGPAYSFKLLSESQYYITNEKGIHTNYSGCGNSFNINHPVAQRLIIDSLKHWVKEYSIDGFRFDLAGSFLRGMEGQELPFSPLLFALSHEPMLHEKLLILEPWDPCGIYKTGTLFREGTTQGASLWEWNDRFRDDTRRFIRGDSNQKGLFATRLSGSEDMYANPLKKIRSMNFVTCHDGFTLHDLVSYSEKDNWDNGEQNRDGTNENCSSNHGEEGETNDRSRQRLRTQQIKNFLIALFLSRGIPMLHQGDEYGHTKRGNNNSWCQDNALNWFQWEKCKQEKELVSFVKMLITFRKQSTTLRSSFFLKDSDIDWHGTLPFVPDWTKEDRYLGFAAKRKNGSVEFYAGFSTSDKKRTIELPSYEGVVWQFFLSTHPHHQLSLTSKAQKIQVPPYSSFILIPSK